MMTEPVTPRFNAINWDADADLPFTDAIPLTPAATRPAEKRKPSKPAAQKPRTTAPVVDKQRSRPAPTTRYVFIGIDQPTRDAAPILAASERRTVGDLVVLAIHHFAGGDEPTGTPRADVDQALPLSTPRAVSHIHDYQVRVTPAQYEYINDQRAAAGYKSLRKFAGDALMTYINHHAAQETA
ncbi:hypothetical protein [Demequina sp.]|uniref:hypothetical protein n=1 Tax=Demequina sp. TaxID=2050685 RepID=UPI003D12B61D